MKSSLKKLNKSQIQKAKTALKQLKLVHNVRSIPPIFDEHYFNGLKCLEK